MKWGKTLLLASLALFIALAMAETSFAMFEYYTDNDYSPAPGLQSCILYAGGVNRFENIMIHGDVHQANTWHTDYQQTPPIEVINPSVFLGGMHPSAASYDTHFLFNQSDFSWNPENPLTYPYLDTDFSDTETNDRSDPAGLGDSYGQQYGMGTFVMDPGEGFAFDEVLPYGTPFMQIVAPQSSPPVFITGLAWDDNDKAFSFLIPLGILYCGSYITTTPEDGGSLEFDLARVGTTVNTTLYVEDNNGCEVCPSLGMFPAAEGEFGPSSPMLTSLLNEGSSDSRMYTYTPNERGSDTQQVVVKNAGDDPNQSPWNSSSEITLSGTGVGPVFQSTITTGSEIDFGDVQVDSFFDISFDIENNTTDGDLGELTDLTLLSAEISGADADMFSLVDFVPGTVLSALDMESILVRFNTSESDTGYRSATLTITTDQGAAFGAAGDQFVFPLVATVVPEPSGFILLALGATVLLGYTRWRKA